MTKQKRKRDHLKLPNVIVHMILVNSLILIVYCVIIRSLTGSYLSLLGAISDGFYMGIGIGSFIGYLQAYFTDRVLKTLPEQFTQSDIDDIQPRILGIALAIPIAFGILSCLILWIYPFIVPISLLTAISAYFYIRRLRNYSRKMFPQKSKNTITDTTHLEDGTVYETAHHDNYDTHNKLHQMRD